MPVRQKFRPAQCHPDRQYYIKGLCQACDQRLRRSLNPGHSEYMREYLKKWRLANVDKVREKGRKERERLKLDPEASARMRKNQRRHRLKTAFGITLEECDKLLASQNSCCAICTKSLLGENSKQLAVDHDHSTGRVRGILCSGCNSGIGMLKDSAELVQAAADYLRNAAANTSAAEDEPGTGPSWTVNWERQA